LLAGCYLLFSYVCETTHYLDVIILHSYFLSKHLCEHFPLVC